MLLKCPQDSRELFLQVTSKSLRHLVVLTMKLTEPSTSSPTFFGRLAFSTRCRFLHVSELSRLCGPAHAAASAWNAFALSSIWRVPADLLRPNAALSTKKPPPLAQAGPQPPHSVQLAIVSAAQHSVTAPPTSQGNSAPQ